MGKHKELCQLLRDISHLDIKFTEDAANTIEHLETKLRDQQDIVIQLANLFPVNVTDMDQLDAADFKDRAGEIWDLFQKARVIVLTDAVAVAKEVT
jgi:hypothetical protein